MTEDAFGLQANVLRRLVKQYGRDLIGSDVAHLQAAASTLDELDTLRMRLMDQATAGGASVGGNPADHLANDIISLLKIPVAEV